MTRPSRTCRNSSSCFSRTAPRRLRCEPLEDRRMLSVLFVDDDAASGGDGLAWSTAYQDLQDALSDAATLNADGDSGNDVDRIWIAEGVYKPSEPLEPGNFRSVSFSLVDGVTLYGGFLGTETALEEREVSAYETVLSGDIGTVGDAADNAYTVVYCGGSVDAGLDGVTVSGGNANGSSTSSYPERDSGGGIYSSGTLTVTNSTISRNSARGYDGFGGGIYSSGTLALTNSTLSGNSATGTYAYGGGVYNTGTLTVTNSTLSGNSASSSYRGGIFSYGGSYGGGIFNYGSSSTVALNNTVVAGNAASSGPDVFHESGSLSGSHNLIGDGTGQSSLVQGEDGNQVGTSTSPIDPGLSDWTELDHGRWGYYLLPGSPALDAGENALAVDAAGRPLVEDLYGNPRIQNDTVEIGAVEGATAGSPAEVYVVTSLEMTVAEDGVLTFAEAFEAADRNQPVGDAPAGSFTEPDAIRFAEGLSGTRFSWRTVNS